MKKSKGSFCPRHLLKDDKDNPSNMPKLLQPSVRLSVLAAIEKIGPLAAPLGHDIAPGRSVQGMGWIAGTM